MDAIFLTHGHETIYPSNPNPDFITVILYLHNGILDYKRLGKWLHTTVFKLQKIAGNILIPIPFQLNILLGS
jgi:hypothetical protein